MSTFEKVTSSLQYNLRPGTFQSKEFFSPKQNDFRILELLKMIGKSKKIYSPRSQIVVWYALMVILPWDRIRKTKSPTKEISKLL